MTVTPYQLALIAGGFTLAGILIGALLTNYFANRRDKNNRLESTRNDARRKFRRIIAEEIAERDNSDPRKADLSRLANIQAAVIEFKHHLSATQQEKIEETWKKYETLESNRAAQLSMSGYNIGASIKKELLEELLKFTEQLHVKTSR